MVGPLDPIPPATNDRAESEAEAANRQNLQADQDLRGGQANAGHGEPGGQVTRIADTPAATGTGEVETKAGGMASEGEPDSRATADGGPEQGMLGEGV